MSEDGPASGPERRFGEPEARKRLNGHANGHAPLSGRQAVLGRGAVSKKPAPEGMVAWARRACSAPGSRFGALFGWMAVIAFAALFWGIRKDGVVDMIDVFAGLVGVLTALWFHRSR